MGLFKSSNDKMDVANVSPARPTFSPNVGFLANFCLRGRHVAGPAGAQWPRPAEVCAALRANRPGRGLGAPSAVYTIRGLEVLGGGTCFFDRSCFECHLQLSRGTAGDIIVCHALASFGPSCLSGASPTDYTRELIGVKNPCVLRLAIKRVVNALFRSSVG